MISHTVAGLEIEPHNSRMVMKKLTPRTYIILAAGIVLVCAAVFFARMRSAESPRHFTIRKIPSSYQELKRTWEDTFNRAPADAYAEFIKTADALPYNDAHSLAHIVGAILYNREGFAGLSHCTDDFAFGCYHGFAGSVIEKTGIAGVGEFSDACKNQENVTVCEHGIGHGLLAYLGSDTLTGALELCPQVPSGSVDGCYNGVFMEYFLSTLQRDKGVPMLTLDSKFPEGPCEHDVPEKFRPACYYELPAWWRVWASVQGSSYEGQFKIIGKRCASVVDPSLRTVCFKGTGGQIASFGKHDMDRIREWCLLMPESGRVSCLSEALNSVPGAGKGIQGQQTSS